jgi:hypothetical protein
VTYNLEVGKKLNEQIEEAVQSFDWLLLIFSDSSMNSEGVKTEIANARQKEVDQGKRVLLPISLVPFETIRAWKNFDADTGNDSARELREYYIADFSDWKNQGKYQVAFEHLIRALRVENKPQQHLECIVQSTVPQGLTLDQRLRAAIATRIKNGRTQMFAKYVDACRAEGRGPANPGATAVIGSSNGELVVNFRKEGTRLKAPGRSTTTPLYHGLFTP